MTPELRGHFMGVWGEGGGGGGGGWHSSLESEAGQEEKRCGLAAPAQKRCPGRLRSLLFPHQACQSPKINATNLGALRI